MLIIWTLNVPLFRASQASADIQSLKKHLNRFSVFFVLNHLVIEFPNAGYLIRNKTLPFNSRDFV